MIKPRTSLAWVCSNFSFASVTLLNLAIVFYQTGWCPLVVAKYQRLQQPTFLLILVFFNEFCERFNLPNHKICRRRRRSRSISRWRSCHWPCQRHLAVHLSKEEMGLAFVGWIIDNFDTALCHALSLHVAITTITPIWGTFECYLQLLNCIYRLKSFHLL